VLVVSVSVTNNSVGGGGKPTNLGLTPTVHVVPKKPAGNTVPPLVLNVLLLYTLDAVPLSAPAVDCDVYEF
jgi:hypothetical protein